MSLVKQEQEISLNFKDFFDLVNSLNIKKIEYTLDERNRTIILEDTKKIEHLLKNYNIKIKNGLKKIKIKLKDGENKRFYIETYGCTQNQSESMILEQVFSRFFLKGESVDDADVVILNTCGVKTNTEDKIVARVKKLYPKKNVILTGCLLKINKPRLQQIGSELVLFSNLNYNKRFHDLFKGILPGQDGNLPYSISFPISQGCTGDCTFCAVKFARGKVKSYPIDKIVKNIKKSIRVGFKEIYLTSQDTAAFGKDTKKFDLVDLMEQVARIPGKFKVRIGMMNPDNLLPIIDRFMDVLNEYEVFYKFVHIPVQSGSNRILERMKRDYVIEEFISIINKIRSKIPKIVISTDIIVGFPGETLEDFNQTLDLVEKIRFDIINISKYGDRKNTEASRMKNKISTSEKKRRSSILSKLHNKIFIEKNKQWINWSGDVLITHKNKKGYYHARNPYYKMILLEDGKVGAFASAKIIRIDKKHLIGKLTSF